MIDEKCSMAEWTSNQLFILLKKIAVGISVTTMVLTIGACASPGNVGTAAAGSVNSADRILACKSTDRLVESREQCLLDDAACYQISGGKWCTGPRGNVCPAGSVPLPAGAQCPPGSRCFTVGESLNCRI